MKLLLNINDDKVSFFMKVIQDFDFITEATPLSNSKAELMTEIKESVEELNLIRSGKLKGISAKELLRDL
tara:strand:+ start:11488 stop:11697 length:210 start_codon:yes stop_codon:yes gene_type:complete